MVYHDATFEVILVASLLLPRGYADVINLAVFLFQYMKDDILNDTLGCLAYMKDQLPCYEINLNLGCLLGDKGRPFRIPVGVSNGNAKVALFLSAGEVVKETHVDNIGLCYYQVNLC